MSDSEKDSVAMISAALFRKRDGGESTTVHLEPTAEELLNGVRKPIPAELIATAVFGNLVNKTFDERTQMLEAIRVLVSHPPQELSNLVEKDRRIRIVEIPKRRFKNKKWRKFPLRIFGMCYLSAESSVPYPVAGIFFAVAKGRRVLPCLSTSSSLNNRNARAACKLYAEEMILVIMDMVSEAECPPLTRLLKRARPTRS